MFHLQNFVAFRKMLMDILKWPSTHCINLYQIEQEYCMTEFLRMSGIYWGVTALDLMGDVSKLDKASIVEFIKKCQCSISGGISPCENHDPHILYTLSAVQVIIRKSIRCLWQQN